MLVAEIPMHELPFPYLDLSFVNYGASRRFARLLDFVKKTRNKSLKYQDGMLPTKRRQRKHASNTFPPRKTKNSPNRIKIRDFDVESYAKLSTTSMLDDDRAQLMLTQKSKPIIDAHGVSSSAFHVSCAPAPTPHDGDRVSD